jgi:Uma2 family endonuclease
MKIEEPDLSGTYTYSDYLTWSLPEMVELIKGKIFKMSPAPSSTHQKISMMLTLKIGNFLTGRKCQLFVAPFDVRLPQLPNCHNDKEIITVVQPDLCVVCAPEKIDERGCIGAPDWIIEILSKHTSAKDFREKFQVYEEAGVKEYWVVHPQEQTILVYLLNSKGKYEGMLTPYIRTDHIAAITLPGLVINLEEIFPEERVTKQAVS